MAFRGKLALVTGGASGMGREMALRLAAQGATVAIADMNDAALASTAATNPLLRPYRCDVSDEAQVADLAARIERELGPIDRLAHAAGVMPGGAILDSGAEAIKRVMRINYFGTVNVMQAVLPRMLDRGQGDVVCFGSITGYAFSTRLAAYCASKAAVNAYMEILIQEHRRSGLRILLVCPPAVDTPLIGQATAHGPKAIRDAAGKHRMMSAGVIIDAVEAGLERGKRVILPGEAGPTYFLRRLSPSLLWKVANRTNGD